MILAACASPSSLLESESLSNALIMWKFLSSALCLHGSAPLIESSYLVRFHLSFQFLSYSYATNIVWSFEKPWEMIQAKNMVNANHVIARLNDPRRMTHLHEV